MTTRLLRRSEILAAFAILLLLAVTTIQAAFYSHASANQITSRRLTLQAGATDGGSKPSGVVNHFFEFTLPAVGNPSVGSIKFQYCTTAADSPASPACVTPAGLTTTAATMGSQSGATGFTLNNSTNGA